MAKPEGKPNSRPTGQKASLYDIKRVCLSGEDLAKLLRGQPIHASNGRGGDYAAIVFDGSNPQAVEAGLAEYRKNLTDGPTHGTKK